MHAFHPQYDVTPDDRRFVLMHPGPHTFGAHGASRRHNLSTGKDAVKPNHPKSRNIN
jgi:hypothetical protein